MQIEIINVAINEKDDGCGKMSLWLIQKFGNITYKKETHVLRVAQTGCPLTWKIQREIDEGFEDTFNINGPIKLEPMAVWVDCNEWFSRIAEKAYEEYLKKLNGKRG